MDKTNKQEKFLKGTQVTFVWFLLFVSLITVAGLGAFPTFSLWLKPVQLNTELQKHVNSILGGFPAELLQAKHKSNAQNYIDAIHGGMPNKAFFLYRLTEGKLQLQAQTQTLKGYLPSPILADHTSDLVNWVEIRRIIRVNEEDVGLLIATTSKQRADYQFILLLLVTAIIASILLTRIIINTFNRSVTSQALPLFTETNMILKKENFERRLAVKKFESFSPLAGSVNALFKKVDQLRKNNNELETYNEQLAQDMESKINERTNALRIAMEEAEQANESKSTFLATMSHEIRTPMNGIIGSIDLLRNSTLNQNQFRLSDTIRESAFSLLRIIDDILDFSKIEAGKLEVESIPMSINGIIEAVGRTLLSVAEQKQIELRLYCDPAIHDGLMGDPIRIRQILFNLAGNAIKFTNSNSEKIGVVQIRAEISETNMEFTNVLLRIIDNGKGMTERQVNYVFQPFNQAEGSVTRQFGGTGLGLTICQRLTDLMYGQINVKSEVGTGSEFSVALPLRSSLDKTPEKEFDFSTTDLVCFSPDTYHINTLASYTKFYGGKPALVQSIDSLMHVAEHYRYDAAVQPIWLLDATAYHDEVMATLEQLSQHQNCQQVRFLLLTNTVDYQDKEQKNVWYLHATPLCRTSLLESIRDVLENKKLQAQVKDEQKEKRPVVRHTMSIEEAREKGQLVLLAEDNAMNQTVITEQLNMLGYAVEVANDGQEAIDMWRINHYPLVLTDLHMPNKSGYDVVQTIRQEGTDIPKDAGFTRVVAITANALKGEEQKCISLGMDGYLTKPLELADLEVVMKKWLDIKIEERPEVQASIATPQVKPRKLEAPIQQSVLVSYLGNDIERHKKYLDMFKARGNELIDQISDFVKNQERENIKNFAHQFKSMSKSVGAMPLHESTLEMESSALTADMAELEALFTRILKQFNEVIAFVKDNYQTT